MIEKEVLSLEFFKFAGVFTGEIKNLRYMIEKIEKDGKEVLEVHIWQGPYNLSSTKDEYVKSEVFELSENGRTQAMSFIEEEYNKNVDLYAKIDSVLDCDHLLKDEIRERI